jgi:hypothetical protein
MTNTATSGGTPGPTVRDFLYVDLGRVRSLLAQIARGAPDAVTEKLEGAWKLATGLNLGVVEGRMGRTSGNETTETRSLTDVHFALFEEESEALGLLTDVTELTASSGDWHGGQVRAEVEEGQLIRVSDIPVRLVDSRFVAQSMDRMEKLLDAWADVMVLNAGAGGVAPERRTGATKSGGQNKAERDRARAKVKRETFGGGSPEMITGIKNVMASLLEGDGISLRAMPAGEDHPECSFTGTLLNRNEYIEPERGAIFARLGVRPSKWTMVAIVARFASDREPEDFELPTVFDRAAIESMTIGLMDRLERMGLSAAPAYPSMAVIPIALYRVLPWASQ